MQTHYVVVAASALLVGATAVEAQVMAGGQRPTFGIVAGANLATIGGDDVDDADRRTTFFGGAYVDFAISNAVSIRPGLLYSAEGAKAENVDDEGTDLTLKLAYVRVPVMLRFTGTSGETRPFFAVGPSFGIQVQCDATVRNSGISLTISCDELSDELNGGFQKKTFDMSGRAEAGVDFRMGGRTVTVGAAYSHGFTNVFDDAKATNRVISIFAGLGF